MHVAVSRNSGVYWMAKKRRVKTTSDVVAAPRPSHAPTEPDSSLANSDRIDGLSIATGIFAGIVVYVAYYPSDSIAVESGDALWFVFLALAVATITMAVSHWRDSVSPVPSTSGNSEDNKISRGFQPIHRISLEQWLDISVCSLGLWMMIAALASCPPGNLRMATNEAWFWIAAAAMFTTSRRLMSALESRRGIFVLLVVCSTGLAVNGLHQYFISLPENRAMYELDPERVLQMAGFDAPEGSAERMVFRNRLYDGGPTATFALANSLAAFLLLGVVGGIGVLRFRWAAMTTLDRITWFLVSAICGGCLMGARSRAATLAALIGITLIFVTASKFRRRNPRSLLLGLTGIAAAAIVGAMFLAIFGNREWFEEAIPSLAFRFQYWRSTWQMALDRPWFAAGPGNFQSI